MKLLFVAFLLRRCAHLNLEIFLMSDSIAEKQIVEFIYADRILEPEHAMRSGLNRTEILELADNIKQNGLISPITVRPVGENFEVVAGHRRFSACKMNGMVKIPCVIRVLTDVEALSIMAAENLERQDIDLVDEAIWLAQLMQVTGKDISDIAKMIRRSIGYVEDRLAIASMPEYLQHYLKINSLKLGVALALSQIEEEPKRQTWVEMAVRDGCSVRQAEYWLYQWKMDSLPGGVASDLPPGDVPESTYIAPRFVCDFDGKLYPPSETKLVTIARINIPAFQQIALAFRSDSESANFPPH
ncbi:ParB/RepB/Spo0J family partition protein [Patescibacteria group bacterium]|nr:MAG: ParB/RepB/Spo0J family partition protein [Patescibacteria group bacterium]